jgi:hypothetical protein
MAVDATETHYIARLTAFLGTVRVGKNGGTLMNADAGEWLEVNDRVMTGADGRCEIAFSSESKLWLSPNSDITVHVDTGPVQSLSVTLGELRFKLRHINDNSDKFRFRTSAAVAAVRGTVLGVSQQTCGGGGDISSVEVSEGDVEVTQGSAMVDVTAGNEDDLCDGCPDPFHDTCDAGMPGTIAMTGGSCTFDSVSNSSTMTIQGDASGDVGDYIGFGAFAQSVDLSSIRCGVWAHTGEPHWCTRTQGQPDRTSWSMSTANNGTPGSSVPIELYLSGPAGQTKDDRIANLVCH